MHCKLLCKGKLLPGVKAVSVKDPVYLLELIPLHFPLQSSNVFYVILGSFCYTSYKVLPSCVGISLTPSGRSVPTLVTNC